MKDGPEVTKSGSCCQNLGEPVVMERNHPAGTMVLDRGKQPLPSVALEEGVQEIKLVCHPTFSPQAGPSIGQTQTNLREKETRWCSP